MDGYEEALAIADPIARAIALGRILNALPGVSAEISDERQKALLELKARGMSLAEIAKEVGLARGRVQNLIAGT